MHPIKIALHRIFGLLLIFANAQSHGSFDVEERVFVRAQCKARCLKFFQAPDDAEINTIVNRLGVQGDLASDCLQQQKDRCGEACFSACDAPPSMCQSQCSIGQVDLVGCSLGCLLLKDVSVSRSGSCPVPLREPHTSAAPPGLLSLPPSAPSPPPHPLTPSAISHQCRNQCVDDSSCAQPLQKCCQVGCSRLCSTPIYNDSEPPLAPTLDLPASKRSGVIEMFWDKSYPNFQERYGPLVFILQTRFCACKVFDEEQVSPWQTLVMTAQMVATVDSFDPGQMYQFRLAAVGTHGSRGFGPASKPFPLRPKRPDPPSPPRNVTATRWRIHPNGLVNVRLSWTPPEMTDLPLVNYSISWVRDHGYPGPTSRSMEANNRPIVQTVKPDVTEYSISDLLPGSLYKVQVTAVSYWHGEGKLESQPHTIILSPQSLQHPGRRNSAFEGLKHPAMIAESINDDCRCGGLAKNDDRLAINPPEIFNGDLTAIVQLKSFSHMDDRHYHIEWFPQVCIDSGDNLPMSSAVTATAAATASSSASSPDFASDGMGKILKATVSSRIFRLTKLKFNCVYMVRLTPEKPVALRAPFSHQPRRSSMFLPGELHRNQEQMALDVVAACFCTRSCRDTKTAWSEQQIECPKAESPPPQPPRDIKVELINYDRMDYQISWLSPLPPQQLLASPGSSHPAAANSFSRYRIMWGPRKEEPVDASMYNTEAGFSPIPDLQQSDVRVVDKNQTSLILHQLRPRTIYILRIQTLGSGELGQERESQPVVQYFVTHDQFARNSPPTPGGIHVDGSGRGMTTRLQFGCTPMLLLLTFFWAMPP